MKKNGKNICKELKAIRRRVADENGIPLELPWATEGSQRPQIGDECQYDGPCDGTCPRCEAEVRYLEAELHRRMTLGKAAAVAGVALGLAAFTSCTEGKVTEGEIEPDPVPEVNDTTPKAANDINQTIQYQ